MRNPPFSALRERLLRAGVSPRGVRRVIGELEDHFADILRELEAQGVPAKEARSQAFARLGAEDVLAASILAKSELMSWAHRRPAVAFALLPVPAFAASFVVSIVVLAAAGHCAHAWFHVQIVRSAGLQLVSRCFSLWILWLLPTAMATLCGYAAWRRRVTLLWPAVGILIVGLFGALTSFGVQWATATSRGALTAGIGFGTAHAMRPLLRAASTIGIALLVYCGGWLAHRREIETPTNETLPLARGE
jgi:hypothetical protein